MSTELLKEEFKDLILEAMKEIHSSSVHSQEWWNLRDAVKRKGLSYKTSCNRRELQPNRGIPDGKVGGRKVWHWTTIEEWIGKTDVKILGESCDE